MKYTPVTSLSLWPAIIEQAGNVFANQQQLDRLVSLEKLFTEMHDIRGEEMENLLAVMAQEDESILIDLVQSYDGVPIIGGKWLQVGVSPEGIVSMASGSFGDIVTDPPGYN